MSEIVKEEEVNQIVKDIIADFNKGKNIDATDIFNTPDKSEIHELVNNLFKIVYPGYLRKF